jgi:hypothetical protein
MGVAFAFLLLALGQSASANWTFCVAESDGGKQIWITGVFLASHERGRLEADFKSVLRTRGVSNPVVQCPAPSSDKTEVMNSQFIATEFHRRMGDVMHSITAPEFEPTR